MTISGPISAIIVSSILTLGVLFGTNAFNNDKNYATVSFDGGYKRIGFIEQEVIHSNAVISLDDGTVMKRGDIDEVIEWIYKTSANTAKERGSFESVTWRDGISIKANAGIEWTGSVSKFILTTHTFEEISTTAKPLFAKDVVSKLENLTRDAKAERIENSKESLSFDKAPSSGSLKNLLSSLVN